MRQRLKAHQPARSAGTPRQPVPVGMRYSGSRRYTFRSRYGRKSAFVQQERAGLRCAGDAEIGWNHEEFMCLFVPCEGWKGFFIVVLSLKEEAPVMSSVEAELDESLNYTPVQRMRH